MNLQDVLRHAQELEGAGRFAEALAELRSAVDVEDPFVPWIWYFAAVTADRMGKAEVLIELSRRFNESPLTAEPDYRTAHVDMLVKRVVSLCRAGQPVGDDVAALVRLEPTRNELDAIYAARFDAVLPKLAFINADQSINIPWRRSTAPIAPVRLGAPHYALEKRLHKVSVPQLHVARRATYVTTGADGGLWKGRSWYRGLGTGHSVERTLTLLQSRGSTPVRLPGRGLIMGDQFTADNYCHWTMDWVPRALLASEFGGGFDWVFTRGTRKPFQLDWFRLLGIDPFRVIFEDGLAWYRMDEFIFSDSGSIAVTHPGYGAHPEVVRRIRAAARLEQGATPRRRLFISRKDGGGRRIANEAEVRELLVSNGFQEVVLSEMTLAEQIAAFSDAEAVVGVHGAGLTNVIYMQEGAMLIEILHHRYGTNSFAMPASRMGIRYAYLSCGGQQGESLPETARPPANPTDFITASVWVDTGLLGAALKSV